MSVVEELRQRLPDEINALHLARDVEDIELVRFMARQYFICFCCAVMPKFIPERFHIFLADYLQKVYENIKANKDERLTLSVPPQHGKAHSHDTPILTTKGWVTHGDLQVGDFVFGRDGQPVRVIALSEDCEVDCVVKFSDGSEIFSHDNHEWIVFDRQTHENEEKIIETKQFFKESLVVEEKGKCGFRPRFQVDPNGHRAIVGVEKVAVSKPGRCIQVEGGVYLVGKTLIPTHNSTIVSELFPAWIMGKQAWPIICASYGTSLAEVKSQNCRTIVDSEIYRYIFPKSRLNPDSTSKEYWRTANGASYKAVGRGSGLTGHPGKILLADDLIADRAEASSETVREGAWSWWNSTFYTRKQSKSGIVLINTRWHLDDIQGKIEQQEKENLLRFGHNGMYDRWKKINFPAIAEEDEYIEDKLFRKIGEPLAPQRFSLEDLIKTKNSYIATGKIGEWAALYQGSPIIAENSKFKREWFRYYTPEVLIGKQLYYTTTVDLAISQKKTADNTVIRTVAKEVDGPNWYLMEETSGHLDPLQTIDAIFYHYGLYRSKFFIESVAYQAALQYFLIEEQRKRNIFFAIEELKQSKLSKKEERIEGLIPLYKAGVIYHRKGQDEPLEMELMQFPFGAHDDRIDVLSMQLQVVRHAPREQGVEKQEGRLNWRSKFKRVVSDGFDKFTAFDKI